MNGMVAGSFPCAAHSARYRSPTVRARDVGPSVSTLMRNGTVQVAVSGFAVPYHIGGIGRCTGFITIGTLLSW